ncbi:MAG: hypothetical protein FWC90_01460 [Oscillospiraceae bacterium]|nr:hypothetical protein [Oscillospiraceae bacterium]
MKKKILFILAASILAIALLASCAAEEQTTQPADTTPAATAPDTTQPTAPAETEPAETEPESRFMEIRYATGFSVEYLADNITIVTDAENQRFLLVPRGQVVPTDVDDDMIVIETPIQRAVFGSTTHVGMIAPFDIWGNVAGIVTPHGQVPYLDADVDASGYDILYLGSWRDPDYELLVLSNPDLVFVYTGSSPQTELITMLEELGIPYAVNNEYMEPTYQGRMEWKLFFAPFFGIDEQVVDYVNNQFAMLEEMYAVVADAAHRPNVAWGLVWQGTIWVSGADSFVANQVRSAGGEWMFDVGGQISFEEFYAALVDADVFILAMNAQSVPDYESLLAMVPIIENAPVIVHRNVWQFHVGYWYFTDRLAGQVIDLAAIFHPELFPNHAVFNYNPLAE